MPDKLTVALEAAKLGAKHALTYFNKDIAVELKVDNTLVTIADKETEQVIRKKFLNLFLILNSSAKRAAEILTKKIIG